MTAPLHLVIGNKVYSSWSLRPWFVLKAFGIPFTETVVPLRSPDTRARILPFSPSGKVPALIDGEGADKVVAWESLAVIEYLADKFPDRAIWPKDAKARAHARCIAAEMHSGFGALRSACSMDVTKTFAPRERSAAVLADVARLEAIFAEARGKFGAGSGAGAFLYGAFSAADAMYAPVLTRLRTYAIPVTATTQAYIDAVLSHPAYLQWLAAAIQEPWRNDNGDADETLIKDLRA
jgi:glutathione S-transferase